MSTSVTHIALVVPDLRAAEGFYQSVFAMALIGREAPRGDGLWATLPFDKGWDDAEAAGIDLRMLALRRGIFVLALFQGDAPPGQVYVIGLAVHADEIVRIAELLSEHWFTPNVPADTRRDLRFHDAFCLVANDRMRAFLVFTGRDGRIEISLMGTESTSTPLPPEGHRVSLACRPS